MVRVLNAVFWVAAPLFAASLLLAWLSYDSMAGLLGDKGVRVVNAVLIGVVMVSSGMITLYEFRLNPIADTERGEWTSRQLFYAVVFTITFFSAFLLIPVAFF